MGERGDGAATLIFFPRLARRREAMLWCSWDMVEGKGRAEEEEKEKRRRGKQEKAEAGSTENVEEAKFGIKRREECNEKKGRNESDCV